MEKQAKEISLAERFALLQAQSQPVLAQLREKLLGWKEQLLPKHRMAEAVNYVLGQWSELTVFCSDGAVPLDNNVSEREWKLFRAARTAALLRNPAPPAAAQSASLT